MGKSKLMSLEEAVDRFVADGDVVYAGYLCIPFALTHEIVRQGKRDLEVVGASEVWHVTELVLAGCCRRIRSGYIAGPLRCPDIQAMMASGELEYEDYSNQGLALMLMAGALGIPFIPTRSFLGTDYLERAEHHPGRIPGYKRLHVMESPFDGQRVVLLPAVRPDLVIMHAQRADEEGNVQMWGHLGDARWGMWAGRKIVVTVEEIVPTEVVRTDPSRTVVPGAIVSAVVHCPYGAHPGGIAGYYDFDYQFLAQVMGAALSSREAFARFKEEWIDPGVSDRERYVTKVKEVIGEEAWQALHVTRHIHPRAPVDYGYSEVMNLPWREDLE
jgi:glutaconate CoA-transferase subunit A